MYPKYLKHFFDIVIAILLFPIWLVLLFLIGPVIYFQDKGTIFYSAARLGKNGEVFNMYKFRSMKMNAPDIRNEDGSTYNAEDDPRLTRIGKFVRKTSLDETPQLLNVIKGDMSLIGPRPDLPGQKKLYEGDEHRKLEIRPGVTGYSQAYYRNTITWKEKIRNDIYYVDNVNLRMDIKVFFNTITSVLKRENVYVKQKLDMKNSGETNIH